MGDFERTFGAGADAVLIIDGFSSEWEGSERAFDPLGVRLPGNAMGNAAARKAARVVEELGMLTEVDIVVDVLTGNVSGSWPQAADNPLFGCGRELGAADWLLLIEDMRDQGYLSSQIYGDTIGSHCLDVCGDLRGYLFDPGENLSFRVVPRLFPAVDDADFRLFWDLRRMLRALLEHEGDPDWYVTEKDGNGIDDDFVLMQIAAVKPTGDGLLDGIEYRNKFMFYRYFNQIAAYLRERKPHGARSDDYGALSGFYMFEAPLKRSRCLLAGF